MTVCYQSKNNSFYINCSQIFFSSTLKLNRITHICIPISSFVECFPKFFDAWVVGAWCQYSLNATQKTLINKLFLISQRFLFVPRLDCYRSKKGSWEAFSGVRKIDWFNQKLTWRGCWVRLLLHLQTWRGCWGNRWCWHLVVVVTAVTHLRFIIFAVHFWPFLIMVPHLIW